ncbi:MAG: hypothetical protein MK074_01935 [Phycisphaerales bacterium]|nr:hypothetical protein [Phycisphaerales bacterium]
MIRTMLLAMVCMLWSCDAPRAYPPEEALKWVRQCGGQLIADANAAWAALPESASAQDIRVRQEAFHAAAGRLLTLQVRLDEEGRPVGLQLRPAFWDNATFDASPQVDIAKRLALRQATLNLVRRVDVALGFAAPTGSADHAMLDGWLGEGASRINYATPGPWTMQLRAMGANFTSCDAFDWPPQMAQ